MPTGKQPEGRQPFGFTGYQPDTVSGTWYAQAREYVPNVGRFVSEDVVKGIIQAPVTLNQYGYCWNRPLGFVDLDGRLPDVIDPWAGDPNAGMRDGGPMTPPQPYEPQLPTRSPAPPLPRPSGVEQNEYLFLSNHAVFDTSANHALLIVVANDRSPHFRNEHARYIPSDIPGGSDWVGYRYFTLGGDAAINFQTIIIEIEGESAPVILSSWNLTAEYNRVSDMNLNIKRDYILLDATAEDITRLLRLMDYFRENSMQSLNYWFFPGDLTYNSNSFLHGLLRAAGIEPYRDLLGAMPGWDKLVAKRYFGVCCDEDN